MEFMNKENSSRRLYITLISVHGLIRGENMELGRDADTGGQTLYVVELARALANHPDVERVDLLTRRVVDKKVSDDYAVRQEKIGEGAYIIRLDCGPKRYLRKEVLWPHLQGFVDQALHHVRTVGRIPDLVHSHYADAGLVGARLAGLLGVPLVHTGHSLGREKEKQLLAKGTSQKTIEERYNISQRIEAEEIALGTAARVIASTKQEVNQQYAEYDNYHPSRMQVIPPGVNLERFSPPTGEEIDSRIASEISKFLREPEKPFILALSRADERKNITSLVRAYGESLTLQQKANLVIVAGNRDDISSMDKGAREVLVEILMLIDLYDLYGKVAFPKNHTSEEVPVMYRLGTSSKGVFINPALTEPFGLTLIEAAASGLPVVATHDGGPRDILGYCQNGLLIDPLDIDDIKRKLAKALSDSEQWTRWSENGIEGAYRHFSWPGHADTYIEMVSEILSEEQYRSQSTTFKTRLPTVDKLAFSAIDNTLFGDEASMRDLLSMIKKQGKHIGYGIATGRTLKSTLNFLKKYEIPLPDILITSVGTEIYYCYKGERIVQDHHWPHHIDYRWEPEKIRKIMQRVPGAKVGPKTQQDEHKISYRVDAEVTPSPREIKRLFRQKDVHAKIIQSEDKIIDILPIRASKGLAIRYLSIKWGIALDRILVVGDSGNDEEMLLGDTLGVVVANHSAELDKLNGKHRVYFSPGKFANGIIDGIEHYNFFGDIIIPEDEGMSAD
jgi:sucrose-phosphate synthase